MVGCLSGFRAQTGPVAKATFVGRLGEDAAPGGGNCGPCPYFASYTLAFALQLRKITENLSQFSRKALGLSAPNAIRLVDLAIAGDGLDWLAGYCRPWLTPQATVSTLGQRICRVPVQWGSPRQLTFESKLAVRGVLPIVVRRCV